MNKYDSMIACNKKASEEKVNRAVTEIRQMLTEREKVTVPKLTKRTGLSRGFFYKNHPDFFKTNGYIGRGIGGQTSYQFLLRFREDVINLSPALVVINAGTNDVAENVGPYNEEYTFGNIISMVEL